MDLEWIGITYFAYAKILISIYKPSVDNIELVIYKNLGIKFALHTYTQFKQVSQL